MLSLSGSAKAAVAAVAATPAASQVARSNSSDSNTPSKASTPAKPRPQDSGTTLASTMPASARNSQPNQLVLAPPPQGGCRAWGGGRAGTPDGAADGPCGPCGSCARCAQPHARLQGKAAQKVGGGQPLAAGALQHGQAQRRALSAGHRNAAVICGQDLPGVHPGCAPLAIDRCAIDGIAP